MGTHVFVPLLRVTTAVLQHILMSCSITRQSRRAGRRGRRHGHSAECKTSTGDCDSGERHLCLRRRLVFGRSVQVLDQLEGLDHPDERGVRRDGRLPSGLHFVTARFVLSTPFLSCEL